MILRSFRLNLGAFSFCAGWSRNFLKWRKIRLTSWVTCEIGAESFGNWRFVDTFDWNRKLLREADYNLFQFSVR